jgi:hypothetical protein
VSCAFDNLAEETAALMAKTLGKLRAGWKWFWISLRRLQRASEPSGSYWLGAGSFPAIRIRGQKQTGGDRNESTNPLFCGASGCLS